KLTVTSPQKAGSSAAFQIIPIFTIVVSQINPITGATITSLLPGAFQVNAQATQNGAVAVPQAAYGIWNAATIMSESFMQRHDEYDLIGRLPLCQTDCSRWYGLFGARHVAIWERYNWRTVSVQTNNP